uniref:Alpha/beta hydrolase n=1 Tax=Ascaris lumbricoides TaxID=6252 RepID=A0A0M3I116_ASCLU
MSSATTGIHPAFIEEHRLRSKDHLDLEFGRKFEEWLKVPSTLLLGQSEADSKAVVHSFFPEQTPNGQARADLGLITIAG